MKSLNLNIGIIALIIIVILSNAIYIVNDKQTAILLRFGEIVEPEINPGPVSYTHLRAHETG